MTALTGPDQWRQNNFDLLRLGAAFLVFWYHGALLFHIELPMPLERLTNALPGVPMFFVISGFLIASSIERRRDWRRYSIGRALRIYPALWLCFAVTLVLIWMAGYLPWSFAGSPRFAAWVGLQVSLGTTTPEQVRGFGVGTPNASLWTIAVGLQFYVFLPLLYAVLRRAEKRRADLVLVACATASIGFHVLSRVTFEASASHTAPQALLHASLLPHLWLFLIGTIAYRNRDVLWVVLAGRGIFWAGLSVVLLTTVLYSGFTTVGTVGTELSNVLGLALLSAAVLSLAFTNSGLANRLLGGNDISYGVFLFHFVFLSAVVEFVPGRHGLRSLALVVLATVGMATASWVFVERPAQRLRRPIESLLGVRAPAGAASEA